MRASSSRWRVIDRRTPRRTSPRRLPTRPPTRRTSPSSRSSTSCRRVVRVSESSFRRSRRSRCPRPRRAPPLVQRARALRALLVSLLCGARARSPALASAFARRLDRRAASRRRRSATRFIASSSTSRSTRRPPRRVISGRGPWLVSGCRGRGARAHLRIGRRLLRIAARARLAGLSGARPERPFIFEHDGVLIRGRLDVLWQEGDRALVVDYKSNALEGREPAEIVEAEYGCSGSSMRSSAFGPARLTSRSRTSSSSARRRRIDVVHGCDDVAELEAELSGGDRAHPSGRLPPDAERVRVRGLPCARPRLRRAAPRSRRAIASRCARRRDQRHPREPACSRGGARGHRARGRRRDRRRRGQRQRAVAGGGLRSSGPIGARIVRGNADRAEEVDGAQQRARSRGMQPVSAPVVLATVTAWPLTLELTVEGLGDVLLCHSTPHVGHADLHADHARRRAREARRRRGSRRARLRAHAHAVRPQALERASRREPGSVGMPYEGQRGAYWAAAWAGRRVPTHRVRRRGQRLQPSRSWVLRSMRGSLAYLLEPPGSDATTEYFESLRAA